MKEKNADDYYIVFDIYYCSYHFEKLAIYYDEVCGGYLWTRGGHYSGCSIRDTRKSHKLHLRRLSRDSTKRSIKRIHKHTHIYIHWNGNRVFSPHSRRIFTATRYARVYEIYYTFGFYMNTENTGKQFIGTRFVPLHVAYNKMYCALVCYIHDWLKSKSYYVHYEYCSIRLENDYAEIRVRVIIRCV